MDNQPNALLNWTLLCQGKSMDELRQWLLVTTMELENTRAKAQEELKMRENQIAQLKDLLNRAIKEKDDAEEQCQRLLLERLMLQQQQQQQQQKQQQQQQKQQQHSAPLVSGVSSIDEEPRKDSSDSAESIVSSPPPQRRRELPGKGKFLEAVMKAGPLLQTLMLAGPLPQWRHPPPPMESYQIPPPPPVAIPSPPPLNQDSVLGIYNCGRIINRKRGFFDDSDSAAIDANKYQRVVL